MIECQGMFQKLPKEYFNLDPKKQYCDQYLWDKGLWEKYGGIVVDGVPAVPNRKGEEDVGSKDS